MALPKPNPKTRLWQLTACGTIQPGQTRPLSRGENRFWFNDVRPRERSNQTRQNRFLVRRPLTSQLEPITPGSLLLERIKPNDRPSQTRRNLFWESHCTRVKGLGWTPMRSRPNQTKPNHLSVLSQLIVADTAFMLPYQTENRFCQQLSDH